MKLTARKIGQCGEIAAARYLRDNGYDIITANFRMKMGEIDIVAMSPNNVMVFVEVKTRNEDAIANPSEWVTREKQNKIIATA
ncbi:MAG: YraN family protein, partial [Clostridia bacterium]|nr:YraN family protein [Clostridia bacterium]